MRKLDGWSNASFAHLLDHGGMRRAWLRGRENLHKRYLIHVAGFNLSILMRALFGCGTPRADANAAQVVLFIVQTDSMLLFAFVAQAGAETGALLIGISGC
jgi:transposase